MPIDTLCPGCQAKLRIGDEFAGQEARCPRCDKVYVVPAAPVVPEPAAAPPAPPVVRAHTPVAQVELDAPAPRVVEAPVLAPPAAQLSPADGSHWFLRTPEGPIYGPATEVDFQRWVQEGRVTPDCFVSAGDNTWRPALEVFPELAAPRQKVSLRASAVEKLRKQPHRGALILILGIMGIVTTCPIPSIMAWVMGSYDLGEMHMGRMDESGQGMTNVGRMLGMIFSMVYVVSAVIAMFVLVLVAART